MERSHFWRRFYDVVKEVEWDKYGGGAERYHHSKHLTSAVSNHVNFMMDIYLDECGRIVRDNPNIIGFPVNERLQELAENYITFTRTEDRAEFDRLEKQVVEMTKKLEIDMREHVNHPTAGRKIAIKILESVKQQKDPNNRVVTETTLSPVCDGVYEVSITSNCDGWAEDTKNIGYTLDKNLSLNGKTESNAKNICGESVELLAKLLKTLNKEGIVNDDKIFIDSPLEELIEFMACSLLIEMNGSRNIVNERKLKALIPGCTITPGDQDSFGWLVGCINLDKGTVCYG